MQKHRSIFATLAKISAITLLFALTTLALLLEPNVRIYGFAETDCAKLNTLNNNISIIGRYGSTCPSLNQDKLTNLSQIPKNVINAFIATEDKRYYKHNGVDWLRVLGAAKNNVKTLSFGEGASTITQQLIKNTHLTGEKSIKRKIQEIRIARDIERKYSKDEILLFYLNALYFGNNVYGISAASKYFFNKKANELKLSEAATLAAIINNPSKYNPTSHISEAKKRRNLVLSRMLEQGYIKKEAYDNAIAEDIVVNKPTTGQPQYFFTLTNELTDKYGYLLDELRTAYASIQCGFDEELSSEIQNILTNAKPHGTLIRTIVLKNDSGLILADNTSSSADISKVNRSIGSTIKPLLCYAPALENGYVHLCTPILDEKTSFSGWTPSNYKDNYHGWTDVESSLVHSMNVPAIKLLEVVDIEYASQKLNDVGLKLSKEDKTLYSALGSLKNGFTLPDLCAAYATFANGGIFTPARYVESIAVDGKATNTSTQKTRVYNEDTAALITHTLLKCAKSGTARKLCGFSNVAAKTGTVGTKNGNTDAYCIAYTPTYTVGVWIGAEKKLMPNEISGGEAPTKISASILSLLNDTKQFRHSDSVEWLDVDAAELNDNKRILLAGSDLPQARKRSALFSKRYAPKEYSNNKKHSSFDSFLDDFYDFKILYRFCN